MRAYTVLSSARISAKPASTAPRSSFTSVSMSVKRPQKPLSIPVILHTSCFVSAIRCFWMMSIAVSTRFCAPSIISMYLRALKNCTHDSRVLPTS